MQKLCSIPQLSEIKILGQSRDMRRRDADCRSGCGAETDSSSETRALPERLTPPRFKKPHLQPGLSDTH